MVLSLVMARQGRVCWPVYSFTLRGARSRWYVIHRRLLDMICALVFLIVILDTANTRINR